MTQEHTHSGDRNIEDVFASDDHGKKPVKLGEGDRLKFAQQILGGLFVVSLFVVSLLVMGGYAFNPDNKAWAEIFELIKVGALPLVTLVIGSYFSGLKSVAIGCCE